MPNRRNKSNSAAPMEWAWSRNPPNPAAAHHAAAKDKEADSVALTAWRKARRVVVFIFGSTLVLLGLLLLVLPGPGLIVIPAGLAVLALEFGWARRLLRKARSMLPHDNGGNASDRPQSRRAHDPPNRGNARRRSTRA